MPDIPHTLIIGDNIGRAVYDALFTIPGTGAIWRDIWTSSSINPGFWSKEVSGALEDIAKGVNAKTPDRLPDTVLVFLGKSEILNEPDKPAPDDLKAIAEDTGKLADALRALKLKVLWILPPAIKKEGVTRATITQALAAKGVRVFPADHSFEDPSTRGESAKDISPDTAQRMADLIATWAPLGGLRKPILPRHPQETPPEPTGGGLVTGFFSGGTLGGMSTGGKVALAGGVAALLGGAIWYGFRRRG